VNLKKLNEPKGTSVSISFVSNDGIQDDLSTSQIDFCDIKETPMKIKFVLGPYGYEVVLGNISEEIYNKYSQDNLALDEAVSGFGGEFRY
jgi:hypothetical protein